MSTRNVDVVVLSAPRWFYKRGRCRTAVWGAVERGPGSKITDWAAVSGALESSTAAGAVQHRVDISCFLEKNIFGRCPH